MLLDSGKGNRGGHPEVTYHDIHFPQLGRATSKSALMMTMISGSNGAGKPIPPTFNFRLQLKQMTQKQLESNACDTCLMWLEHSAMTTVENAV